MVDERAIVVDGKLAKLEAAQRQIGEQVAELRAAVERNATETGQTMDQVCSEILGAVAMKQAESAVAEPVYFSCLFCSVKMSFSSVTARETVYDIRYPRFSVNQRNKISGYFLSVSIRNYICE